MSATEAVADPIGADEDIPLPEPPREGAPAPVVRIFGWAMLAALAVYMINNFVNVRYDLAGAMSALEGGDAIAWLQLALYPAALALVVLYVFSTSYRSLRWESKRITEINLYLVRVCFWGVLLCGLADAAIAFLRVEDLLVGIIGEQSARDFGRARYLGTWVHIPLLLSGFVLALFSRTLGFTWLALLIVLAELLIVITRFVFSYEQAFMGDLVRYWYAALFLFASAYTLLDEGHVRVDVLYAGFGPTTRGFTNAIGSTFLGMTTCWAIILVGFGGKQSIINSPVANFEVTQTGGVGMFIKYQMALFIGIFAITMLIQFVAYLFESYADWRGEPGGRPHESTIAH